jgi:DNA-binding NtrC family response regulator
MFPSPITGRVSSRPLDAEDEFLAVRHHLPLLISARCTSTVTAVAQRIHAAAFGLEAPFISFAASDFVKSRQLFADQWSLLMLAGHGGSILITSVERTPIPAQALLAESLDEMRRTRPQVVARVITGTTVSLLDRATTGQFSEDLLYRLNAIHLQRREVCNPCPECAARR